MSDEQLNLDSVEVQNTEPLPQPHPMVPSERVQEGTSPKPATVQVALTDEQLEDLHQLFSLLDEDNSGAISNDELGELMHLLGVEFSKDEVEAMVREIDENNDGEIQFEEFVAVMARKMRAYYPPEEVKSAFAVFAGSAPDGQIKMSVLERALQEYGSNRLSAAEAKALVAGLRTDAAGFFAYSDYLDDMYEAYDG